MNPLGLLFVAVGLFSVCGAACDWDWFMMSRRAQLIIMIFGRTGARIAYGLLGMGFVVLGTLVTLGLVSNRG